MATPNVDVKFFKPFIDGTISTLKTQCKLEATPGKPALKKDAPTIPYDIAAVIGLTSSAFTGSITLGFPKAVFLTLMNNMLGESFTDISKDLEDGAAELLNIIFGQAKVVLNAQGYDIQKAIPSIVRGDNLSTTTLTHGPVIFLPFTITNGTFFIEFSIEGASIA